MSTKNTIFLTQDDEHCYMDCRHTTTKEGKPITNFIDIDFVHKNSEIVHTDEEGFTVRIYPDTELHAILLSLSKDLKK